MFDGRKIYRLIDVGGVFMQEPQIACAPLVDRDNVDSVEVPVIRYMSASGDVHQIAYRPILTDADQIDVLDTQRSGEESVLWRFETLTLQLWRNMGLAGKISGFDDLESQLTTDDAVQQFYLDNFARYWNVADAGM